MTAPDAKTLYQELILDHGKAPRNVGRVAEPTHQATVHNPLCGDRVTLQLRVAGGAGGVVEEARFEARGCMIARASASLLTEAVAGKSVGEALALVHTVDELASAPEAPAERGEAPRPAAGAGSLEPLRGVREFPARRACVTLPWQALATALATSR